MRDIERDILLASSGELSRWRRLRLASQLRRDPEARRLAETLSLGSLLLERAPAGRRPFLTVGWLATGAVATAAVGLVIVLRSALSPDTTRVEAITVSAPLSETTRLLLVAGLSPLPGPDDGFAPDGDAPLLPPWSTGLDDGLVWDLMPERSQ